MEMEVEGCESLDAKSCRLQDCLHQKNNQIFHLKRAVATGRSDGTGTDYKAELAIVRQDTVVYRKNIREMEQQIEANDRAMMSNSGAKRNPEREQVLEDSLRKLTQAAR